MSSIIYLLLDPRSGDVRYVGQTCRPNKRFSQHRTGRGQRGHCLNWERELIAARLCCEISIIEEGLTDEQAKERERWWIAHGRELGWPLTNITDGGEGSFGYKASTETREKIRRALLGRKLPRESVEKRSISVRGSKRSPETRERMCKAQRGHRPSSECLRKAHQASRRKHSSEEIEKVRRAVLGIKRSPETNLKHSMATRGMKRSPEQIERIRQGALRGWEKKRREATS